jgi:hypothetical protein
MYANILKKELTDIIKNVLDNNSTPEKQNQELMILINTVIDQNYLQFNNQYYKQDEGLAVGAPTSGFLAEIFIQYLEHTNIINILKNITFWIITDMLTYVGKSIIIRNVAINCISIQIENLH